MKTHSKKAKPETPWNWRKSAESVLKLYLEHLWKRDNSMGMGSSSSTSRHRILDADDEAGTGSNLAQETTSAEPKFALPWVPKKQFSAQMLAIIALSRLWGAKDLSSRLEVPSQITLLRLRIDEDTEQTIASALTLAIEHWMARKKPESVPKSIFSVLAYAAEKRNLPRFVRSPHEAALSEIRSKIEKGEHVVVVAGEDLSLDDVLSGFCELDLTLPGLDRPALAALGQLVHRAARGLSVRKLLGLLPADHLLKGLTPIQVDVALRDPRLDNMLAKLARYAEPRPARKDGICLDDIHGQDEAVQAFQRMIKDLELWQSGQLEWTAIAASAIMFGPPGNGKTSLAHAFATSAGIELIATSYAECQAHGHQGDMLKALKRAFMQARDNVPAILFIDEIDSFSERGSEKSNDNYLRGVVNGLLAELSKAAQTPGLIILAATNDLTVVDPAVIRPGRFDLKIPVRNPDRSAIRRILLDHLGTASGSISDAAVLDSITRDMVGLSGAGVAAKAREALGRARENQRQVLPEDFGPVRQSDGSDSNAFLYRAAVHEAGHLVINAMLDLPPARMARITAVSGLVEAKAPPVFTEESANAYLTFILSGMAAEALLLGTISSGAGNGAESDLARATQLAIKMESEWGLHGDLIWQPAELLMARGISGQLRQRVAVRLEKAKQICADLLHQNSGLLHRVAMLLVEKRELGAAELEALFSDVRSHRHAA